MYLVTSTLSVIVADNALWIPAHSPCLTRLSLLCRFMGIAEQMGRTLQVCEAMYCRLQAERALRPRRHGGMRPQLNTGVKYAMRMESIVPCAAHKHLREHQGAPGLLVRPVRTRWWPGGQRTSHPCAPGRHAGKESPVPAPLREGPLVFEVGQAPETLPAH